MVSSYYYIVNVFININNKILFAMDAKENLLTLPQQLYIKDSKEITKINETTFIELLKSNSLIGLYFSGHWCPPCNHFTPQLINFYNAVNKEEKQIEIIFISHDEDEDEFQEYYNEMPWAAVPYDFDGREDISASFNIAGIPSLIVISNKGKLLDLQGKSSIISLGVNAIEKWHLIQKEQNNNI